MPFISDADFAQFQQLKGGGSPAPGAAPASPRAAWQPPGGALPDGVKQFYGMPDYTAQNAEIARRSRAAMDDPNSPTYQSPEQRAKVAAANQAQGAANPGWSWNESAGGGGYWTPDAAHNNAASSQAFNASWTALGKANPAAFDMPTDAQGRAVDARTGDAMSGATTAAQRAQPQGAPQWTPPPGSPPQPTATSAPSSGGPPQTRDDAQRAASAPAGTTPPPASGATATSTSPVPAGFGAQPARQSATGAPGAAWSPGADPMAPYWNDKNSQDAARRQAQGVTRSPGGTY